MNVPISIRKVFCRVWTTDESHRIDVIYHWSMLDKMKILRDFNTVDRKDRDIIIQKLKNGKIYVEIERKY